jgi:REP element-mobilizing transposase RayT
MYYWPQRKALRKKDYDYSLPWYYFITICCKNREYFFGDIRDEKMIFSDMWNIADNEIGKHMRDDVEIDEYIVMPNHVHLIIHIIDTFPVGFNRNVRSNWIGPDNIGPDDKNDTGTMRSFPTISRVIRWIKSRITSRIQKECENYEFSWQKSFYDVIIRNDEQLQKTREYIKNNPKNWEKDTNNIINI